MQDGYHPRCLSLYVPLLPPTRKTLDILTHHHDLACVREPEALAGLPQGERKSWQAFWAGAADLLKRAERS